MIDIVTTVESLERRPDGTKRVEVSLSEDALMPRQLQLARARARALSTVGAADASFGVAKSVTRAIKNTSFGEVNRLTRVVEDNGNSVVIEVS